MKFKHSTVNSKNQRWVIFWVVCLVYFFVYFHRVSTSVIVADLLSAFHTNATTLGFMSSMYFYLYALEQPLVGYLTDKLGSRRVIGYWTMVAAAGCFMFGLAPSIGWATIGRGLIGLGVGGVYVPALKTMAVWFRQNEFAGLLGLLMSVGNLGAVMATTPLAWAADTWGWRSSFFLIGAITLALAFITLSATRDHPESGQGAPGDVQPLVVESCTAKSRSNLAVVLSSSQFWIAGLLLLGVYGTFVTLQGLWATPFLMAALGVERVLASQLNMLIPVGVIVGAPLFGWMSDRFELPKRPLVIAITAFCVVLWVGLVFFYPLLGKTGLAILLLLMGSVVGGSLTLVWGIVRDQTPSKIMGLTSGLLNPLPMLGVAMFQVMTGAILDSAPKVDGAYSLQGFKQAFLVCLVINIVCFGISLGIRKKDKTKAV